MKLVTLAAAGFAVLGAGPAFAQYGPYGPRPMMMQGGAMPMDDVAGAVRGMGLDPVGPPTPSGHIYMQRAADYYGRPMRVIVDARSMRVVSIERLGAPGSIYGGPYASYGGGPYWRRPYGAYGATLGEDGELDRPRARADLGPLPQTEPRHPAQPMPQPHSAPKPPTKAAAITPARPPVPKKRPVSAPQETAGSVEPLAKPDNAAPEAKPAVPVTPAVPPAAPARPAITPVAPLE